MGLFSRRNKSPQGSSSPTSPSPSTLSFGSNPSSRQQMVNRASLTGFSSSTMSGSPALPKVDLPRPPDPLLDPAGYLRSIGAVRERSKIILDKAKRNELTHFDTDMSKMDDVVNFVARLIKVRLSLCHGASRSNRKLARLRSAVHLHPGTRKISALWCG